MSDLFLNTISLEDKLVVWKDKDASKGAARAIKNNFSKLSTNPHLSSKWKSILQEASSYMDKNEDDYIAKQITKVEGAIVEKIAEDIKEAELKAAELEREELENAEPEENEIIK